MPPRDPDKRKRRNETPPIAIGDGSRVAPHNIDAEQGLLASIILEGGGDILTKCRVKKVRPEHFFNTAHQIIYEAACTLNENGKPVDDITLPEQLTVMGELAVAGGVSYINELTRRVDVTAYAHHWLDIVCEKNLRRRIIATAQATLENAYKPGDDIRTVIDGAESAFLDIGSSLSGETSIQPADEAVAASRAYVSKLIANQGKFIGEPSGLKSLDSKTGGFEPGRVYVVAARPGMGKTSLALNCIEGMVFQNGAKKPLLKTDPAILMISLEMPATELMTRLACSKARVDFQKLREGLVTGDKLADLDEVYAQYQGAPLFIDDTGGQTIMEIRSKARQIKAKQGLRAVVIDYIQLIESTDNRMNREQQIAEASRHVKTMAKELGIPVILLAQLNRKSEDEARHPRLSDLRESGSIEQDADVVILISRSNPSGSLQEEEGLTVVKRVLIVAKNRSGQSDVFCASEFVKYLTRFQDPVRDTHEG